MSVFGESGGFGLLGREESLLVFGDIEQPSRRVCVGLSQCIILQLFWGFVRFDVYVS
jgi:hypothetical protein